MKWIVRIFAVAVLAWLGWWAWQRYFITDEQRIQNLLAAMAEAVEHGNLIRMEDAIAADYHDDFGLDKSSLIGGLRSFRSQYDAVFIEISESTVTVDPDHQKAEAVFRGKIQVRSKGEVNAREWRQDRFHVFFRKTDAGWKATRAEAPQMRLEGNP